jgi:probable metal-binding protein
MENVYHAHEVLNILKAQNKPIHIEDLRNLVVEKLGNDAQFTNCSGRLFSFEDLLQFFQMKDKISVTPDGITPKLHNICSH